MKNNIESNGRINNCIIYVRSASVEQGQRDSLESQERVCRAYAAKQGWEVLKVFSEADTSSKVSDREALKQLRDYMAQIPRQVSYVLVSKVDRLSRNQTDYILLKQFFRSLGVELKSATEVIVDTPQDKLVESLNETLVMHEAGVRSARTIEGIRAKKEWLENQKHK